MSTVQWYLLSTWESQARRKVYKDWVSYIYVCDAVKGTALTDSKWRVTKIALDGAGDMDEIWTNPGYSDPATDLVTVQWLTYS